MTRKEKEIILYHYCDNRTFNCTECPLSKKYDKETNEYTDIYACVFDEMSDNMLNKCYDGIKAVIVLPWSSSQISKWEKLLYSIDEARS